MAEARENLWLPILKRYADARVLRPGLDHRALSRWISCQEFWLLARPAVLSENVETQAAYFRDFMIAALVTKPEEPHEILPTRR
ncbi:hypothetical protein GCM10009609_38160 [Pseudonocardia aurantiaca]|uniref:Tetracyclin repressor-like C-terminal domain-containing protein n=1 Tax=Pseudonocardia aurantiaca TaxID=75290 RepID=A0ABW4FRM9_9PSEU